MTIFQILSVTGPVCLVAMLGYVAVVKGVIARPGVGVLAAFVVNFGMPFALFKVLSSQDFSAVANFSYLLAFAFGSGLTYVLSFAYGAVIARQNMTGAALFGMGGAMPNGIMIGIPVLTLTFGGVGPAIVAMSLLVQSTLLMAATMIMCDVGHSSGENRARIIRSAFGQILRNPIIIAIVLGLLVSIMRIPIPAIISRSVDLLAATTAGLGLFVIGALLVGAPKIRLGGHATAVILTKLVFHPAVMFAVMYVTQGIDPVWKTAAVIFASLPMLGTYPAIAKRYGHGEQAAAAAFPATVLSFFTVTAVIWFLLLWQPFGPLSMLAP